MSKFKVGDFVKIIDDCKPEVGHDYGSIHRIVRIAEFGLALYLTDSDGYERVYYDYEVEPAYEPQGTTEGPFYVLALPQVLYKTLEEAEADLKARATEYHQTTYGIFKGVKAMKLVTEVQEVPFDV